MYLFIYNLLYVAFGWSCVREESRLVELCERVFGLRCTAGNEKWKWKWGWGVWRALVIGGGCHFWREINNVFLQICLLILGGEIWKVGRGRRWRWTQQHAHDVCCMLAATIDGNWLSFAAVQNTILNTKSDIEAIQSEGQTQTWTIIGYIALPLAPKCIWQPPAPLRRTVWSTHSYNRHLNKWECWRKLKGAQLMLPRYYWGWGLTSQLMLVGYCFPERGRSALIALLISSGSPFHLGVLLPLSVHSCVLSTHKSSKSF